MTVRLLAAVAGELVLNCLMLLRVRLRAVVEGDVGVIEAKDQRN